MIELDEEIEQYLDQISLPTNLEISVIKVRKIKKRLHAMNFIK